MKLEDAILHCEEVADRCELTDSNRQCEDEHRQLALWLKDYKRLLEQQKIGRWIYTNTIGGMRYYGCAICANQEKDCIADEHEIQWYNYCPNCGARMVNENE